tara:strand:- start:63349 stop:63510 length:162 start_codon:yes stop_codon:yes gene_type:complete
MEEATGCTFCQNCPLWDMSTRGQEWCEGTPIDEEWEICPKPKKREEKLIEKSS